jgi:hypothetical protein
VAEAAVAASVVVVLVAVTSGAVALVHRTWPLEERSTAEGESASACPALRAESLTLRPGPPRSARLYRHGNRWYAVLAEIRRAA